MIGVSPISGHPTTSLRFQSPRQINHIGSPEKGHEVFFHKVEPTNDGDCTKQEMGTSPIKNWRLNQQTGNELTNKSRCNLDMLSRNQPGVYTAKWDCRVGGSSPQFVA